MAGPSGSDKNAQRGLAGADAGMATEQNARAGSMFNLTFPGLEKSEDFYSKLSSGDPNIIAKAIAPASQQITQQATAAKGRLDQQPRGGEKRLSAEMIDANASGERGRLATQSWLSSFPALSSLAQTGIGLSNNQVANAISGNSGAMSGYNNVMKADAAGKASTMGFLGSLAGAGGEAAAAFA